MEFDAHALRMAGKTQIRRQFWIFVTKIPIYISSILVSPYVFGTTVVNFEYNELHETLK